MNYHSETPQPLLLRRAAAALLLLAVPLLLVSLAGRAEESWHDLHQQVERGEIVALPELLDWLEDHYEGQILEIELERENGLAIYDVEMIGPQGQLVEFEFDARSGALIGIEGVNISAMEKTP